MSNMVFPIETNLIAINLSFRRPVIVLGPAGSGKYSVSYQAVNTLNDRGSGKFNYLTFSFFRLDCCNAETIIDYDNKMFEEHNQLLKSHSDRILMYFEIEYMSPRWVARILESMMEGRQIVMVGTKIPYMPVADRCEIVRM